MKSHLYSVTTIVIILIGVGTGCSKNNQQEQAPAIRHTKGLLATIGINSTDKLDTICFRISSSGSSYNITDLTPTARSGGFVVSPRDLIEVAATGSGNWTFTTHTGSRLKVGSKELRGGNYTGRHHISFNSLTISDSAQFVANDAGGGTFYIESAMHKGLFLITEPRDVQPPNPSHETVRFDPAKKQKWFIVPW